MSCFSKTLEIYRGLNLYLCSFNRDLTRDDTHVKLAYIREFICDHITDPLERKRFNDENRDRFSLGLDQLRVQCHAKQELIRTSISHINMKFYLVQFITLIKEFKTQRELILNQVINEIKASRYYVETIDSN